MDVAEVSADLLLADIRLAALQAAEGPLARVCPQVDGEPVFGQEALPTHGTAVRSLPRVGHYVGSECGRAEKRLPTLQAAVGRFCRP